MTTIRLSQRDLHVMLKCAISKWLTTGQLHRLCFADVSLDAVRKSLRRLVEAGYLVAPQREDRMAETLHGIGPKGKALLGSKGFLVEVSRKLPAQREHLEGINDLRVAFESKPEVLAYFFACWELGALEWPYAVIPDAVVGLRKPHRLCLLVEYDRGTEGYETLLRKLRFYGNGLNALTETAVAILAEDWQRIEAVATRIRQTLLLGLTIGGVIANVRESGLDAPIFVDLVEGRLERVSLLDVLVGSE